MPTGIGATLIGFGAVLTTVSDVVGSFVAFAGVAWETFLFYRAGR